MHTILFIKPASSRMILQQWSFRFAYRRTFPNKNPRVLHLSANFRNFKFRNRLEPIITRHPQLLRNTGISLQRRLLYIRLYITHKRLTILSPRIGNRQNFRDFRPNRRPLVCTLFMQGARLLISELILYDIQRGNQHGDSPENPGDLEGPNLRPARNNITQPRHSRQTIHNNHLMLRATLKNGMGLRVHPLKTFGVITPPRQ